MLATNNRRPKTIFTLYDCIGAVLIRYKVVTVLLGADNMGIFRPFVTFAGLEKSARCCGQSFAKEKLRLHDKNFSPVCRAEISARFHQTG